MLADAPPPLMPDAAMGRSLGASSTAAEDAKLASLLERLRGRVLLLVGDSSLRNQFMQLARVGLSFERTMPVAEGVAHRKHTGSFSLPSAIRQPERPDSSNGFWGGFNWMAFSTPANATLVYAKIWGCAGLAGTLRHMRAVAHKHRQRSDGLGGWPPHAVLWNFGLHLLHVYPARPVGTASVRCALSYEALVAESARALRAEFPAARLAYRATNAVCDKRFEGPWAVAARAYHCATPSGRAGVPAARCSEERIARVQASCQRRYNLSLAECAASFMDETNSRAQRQTARSALMAHPETRAELFDAFALTEARCDATADGRHYPKLLATLNERWLEQMLAAGVR